MKKLFGLLLIFAVLAAAIPVARSLGAPPAPPGISANDWIPLGDTAGFVITHTNAPLGEPAKPGFVRGYLWFAGLVPGCTSTRIWSHNFIRRRWCDDHNKIPDEWIASRY
jgi:hypothetical protein